MNESSNSHTFVDVAGNSNGVTCVRIVGSIDIAAADVLDEAFVRILDSPRQAVYVDLACIDFAGATLAHFLNRIIRSLPVGTPMLLCRPTPMTSLLIELCPVDNVAAVSAGLPQDFAHASRAWLAGTAETRSRQEVLR